MSVGLSHRRHEECLIAPVSRQGGLKEQLRIAQTFDATGRALLSLSLEWIPRLCQEEAKNDDINSLEGTM